VPYKLKIKNLTGLLGNTSIDKLVDVTISGNTATASETTELDLAAFLSNISDDLTDIRSLFYNFQGDLTFSVLSELSNTSITQAGGCFLSSNKTFTNEDLENF
jgi:hypothetical protein